MISYMTRILIAIVLILAIAMIVAIFRLFKKINYTNSLAESMTEEEIEQFAQESNDEDIES